MDVAGGRIAVVMFRSGKRFYDARTLSNIGSDGKIVAKSWVLQVPDG